MAISVNQMIEELRAHIGVDATDTFWSDSACLELLNRSRWEILNKFNFKEKEGQYNFDTVQGQAEYTIPEIDFESIQSIGIQDPYTSRYHKLRRIGINVYQNEEDTNTIFQAQPNQYFRREPDKIILYPTPDKVY